MTLNITQIRTYQHRLTVIVCHVRDDLDENGEQAMGEMKLDVKI